MASSFRNILPPQRMTNPPSGEHPEPLAAGTQAAGHSGRSRPHIGRNRRRQRGARLLANRTVRDSIVSLAGLVGRPVRNQSGLEIGRLVDVVCKWAGQEAYPPVTGLVVRVGRRLAFVDASRIDAMENSGVRLSSARLDLRDFEARPGEVTLARGVLDHQLVDVDGVQVIRAADLYLAAVFGRYCLVGVDVSLQSLLRRLGPARWRQTPTPDRVIDWGAIQPFGETSAGAASEVRLRTSNQGLQRLRPGELADLLEDLLRPERQKLLDSLTPEEAADALEEMDPEELATLLREAPPAQASVFLVAMEPDEAVDALRDLNREERSEIFAVMDAEKVAEFQRLLGYAEDVAGGFMTTSFIVVSASETISSVTARLAASDGHQEELDAVTVVDNDGVMLWDLPILQLLVNPPNTPIARLIGDDDPVTVGIQADVREVAQRLIDARRLSIMVIDDEGRPVGRIQADDVVDALIPERGRYHFPRLLT